MDNSSHMPGALCKYASFIIMQLMQHCFYLLIQIFNVYIYLNVLERSVILMFAIIWSHWTISFFIRLIVFFNKFWIYWVVFNGYSIVRFQNRILSNRFPLTKSIQIKDLLGSVSNSVAVLPSEMFGTNLVLNCTSKYLVEFQCFNWNKLFEYKEKRVTVVF